MDKEKEKIIEGSTPKKIKYFGSNNPISTFFIYYVYDLIRLGNKKPLSYEDIPYLPKIYEFESRFKDFHAYYEAKKKANWKMSKILFLYILPIWVYLLLGFLIGNLLGIVYPFVLKELIEWFMDPLGTKSKGMWLCTGIFVTSIIRPFIQQHAMIAGQRSTTLINIIFFGIYTRKLENISMKALKYLNIGKITNSLSGDLLRVIFAAMTAHQLITSPILITVYTIILLIEIGWIALVGIALLVIIMAIQVYLGKVGSVITMKKFVASDARNKHVNSSITGIKTIKFNAWEKVVKDQLDAIRRKERKYAFLLILIRGLVDGFIFIMPLLCALVCIIIYQAIHDDLGLGSTFYIIFIFNLFSTPLRIFFFAMIQTFEAKVALDRVEQSLSYPDQSQEDDITIDDSSLNKGEVELVDCTFSFDDKVLKTQYEKQIQNKQDIPEVHIEPVLYDINLKVNQGEFVAIIGEVGCGKTSLLRAITKSLFIDRGEVKKNGSMAFIPQEAFLANATLKENILIGSELDEKFYNKVVKKCELVPDISMLPAGDLTEIGERGINLSGGQKQRVTIARAVYAQTDIYLIDDSLSALDAHVGQKIFNNVFKGMLNNKTKIMVTHALQYLKDVDRIVYLDKGRIVVQGKFEDLIRENEAFRNFVSEKQKKEKSQIADDNAISEHNSKLIDNLEPSSNFNHPLDLDMSITQQGAQMTSGLCLINQSHVDNELVISKDNIRKSSYRMDSQNEVKKEEETEKLKKGKITKEEARFTGQVDFRIYLKYFKEGGYFYFFFNLVLFAVAVAGRIIADWWVGQWSRNMWELSRAEYMGFYFMIAMITLIFIVVRSVTWGHYASNISYSMFKKLINLIFRKKMSFFDTTPTGQIMNLTSKDTDFADINVPGTYIQAIFMFFQIIGTFVLIGVTNVILIPFLVAVTIGCAYIIAVFLKASMELRRLEQLAFSPILSNIIELYNGLVIYRGFNKINYVRKKYIFNVNQLLRVFYVDRVAQTFTNLIVEIILALLIGVVFYLFSAGKIKQWDFIVSNNSVIALTLNWILMVPLTINFFMFMIAEAAKGMSSIQRLFKNIPEDELERNFENPKAPVNWPSQGKFSAKDVNVKYREGLPLVLKDLNFEIRPAEKIGIVGRTGSGKSSLILALTRILELENEQDGYIKLDDVVINSIGLSELRRNMKVIPQDPLLLKGTLRMNIDPYNLYSDEVVIEALKKSLIWDSDIFKNIEPKMIIPVKDQPAANDKEGYTITDPDKLSYQIEEGGKNLSIGQKQLVCIARALVNSPKVLLMDEATSNIDPNTDLKLQDIIKKQFVNSTIITIAHRLNTIIHYDRIFVLSDGNLVEEGTPLDLLQRDSIFRDMVRENGKEFEEKMLEAAMNKDVSLVEEFLTIKKND